MEYVAGFLINESRTHTVLIRKNKPEWQKGKLNGVGGKVEIGETILDGMIREFREETGVLVNNWNHFTSLEGAIVDVDKGTRFKVDFFFAIVPDFKLLECKTMEEEEVVIYPIKNIGKPMSTCVPNLAWLVPMALSIGKDSCSLFKVEEIR